MAIELPILISGIALFFSVASFGLSIYVATKNLKILKSQKRSELLTRIAEAKIQYHELNQRNLDLASKLGYIPPGVLDMLIAYKEYEKLTQGHYEFVRVADLSTTVLEEVRHHIDAIILHIAADNRRIDEVEKQSKKGTSDL